MMRSILMHLRTNNDELSSKLIEKIIEKTEAKRNKQRKYWDMYTHKNLPISFKEHETVNKGTKVKKRSYSDFIREIVDNKISYVLANPLQYKIKEGHEYYTEMISYLDDYKLDNNSELLDIELAKMVSVCGDAGRLTNVTTEMEIEAFNIKPWECYFVYSDNSEKNEYGIRFYQVELENEKEEFEDIWFVELYTPQFIKKYRQIDSKKMEFVKFVEDKEHYFDYCPLVEFKNNLEHLSDIEPIIDNHILYNELMSFTASQVIENRFSMRVFKGSKPTVEILEMMDKYGALWLANATDSVEFLTNDLQIGAVEFFEKILKDNITRFSIGINWNDPKIGQAQSGEALKYQLIKLEFHTNLFEKCFAVGLRRQMQVMMSFKNNIINAPGTIKTIKYDHKAMTFKFVRNLPASLLNDAQLIEKLFDKIPLKELYTMTSFIEDPEEAIRLMVKEGKVDPKILATDDFNNLGETEKAFYEELKRRGLLNYQTSEPEVKE
jgi:SPP1 family phage portal protein